MMTSGNGGSKSRSSSSVLAITFLTLMALQGRRNLQVKRTTTPVTTAVPPAQLSQLGVSGASGLPSFGVHGRGWQLRTHLGKSLRTTDETRYKGDNWQKMAKNGAHYNQVALIRTAWHAGTAKTAGYQAFAVALTAGLAQS
jgi:hypothetical protein